MIYGIIAFELFIIHPHFLDQRSMHDTRLYQYIMEVVVKEMSLATKTISEDMRLSVSLVNFPIVHIIPRGIAFAGSGKRLEFRLSKTALEKQEFRLIVCRHIPELDDYLVMGTTSKVSLRDILIHQAMGEEDSKSGTYYTQTLNFQDGIGYVIIQTRLILKAPPPLSKACVPVIRNRSGTVTTCANTISTTACSAPCKPLKGPRRIKLDYGNFQQRT